MKPRPLISTLQGRNVTARGEAPGNASPKISPALKGRHNLASAVIQSFASSFCSAPSGRGNHWDIKPRALPWAITARPFRALVSAAAQRLARLSERKLAALGALKKSLLHQAFTGQL